MIDISSSALQVTRHNTSDDRSKDLLSLEAALRRHDELETSHLLGSGLHANVMLRTGRTPLMIAIAESAHHLLPLLVAGGSNVNEPQGDPPLTPLMWACLYGSSRSTVRRLFELGANVDSKSMAAILSMAREGVSGVHVDLVLAQRRRASLGVTLAAPDSMPVMLSRLAVQSGAPVMNVSRYSAAWRAGVEYDDVVVAFDDEPIRRSNDLIEALSSRWAGEIVPTVVIRAGAPITLSVELQPSQGDSPNEFSRCYGRV